MKKHSSSPLTGQRHDRLLVGLVAGVVVGTAVLAGAVGSAFAGVNTDSTTREYAHHIAHDNTTYRR